MSLPKVVVFDLDYTLWPCWCDTHISPPLKAGSDNAHILDKYGEKIAFYRDVPTILREINDHPSMIAVTASRTHAPKVAQQMLNLIHIDGKPSSKYLAHKTWGVGSKIAHFQEIKKLTGVDYKDMVFFDDEMRNRDVQDRLGVTFVLVNEGVTRQAFDRGIKLWSERQSGDNRIDLEH